MTITTLAAFAAAFLVFAASPGPDNLTIVARSLAQGPLHGIAYGAGMVGGILLVLVLASAGLAVLAETAGGLMEILRFVGAGWLVWTGIALWRAPAVLPEAKPPDGGGAVLASFVTGFVLNLGNPKMPLFYLALLPNVVGGDLAVRDVAELAAVVLAVEALVIGAHVAIAGRARRWLRSPRAIRCVNRGAGTVMIGAGVAVAAAR